MKAIVLVYGGIVVLIIGLVFLGWWFLMLLWNWLMPEIFGLPAIGYWQAVGLSLLAHMLTNGGIVVLIIGLVFLEQQLGS